MKDKNENVVENKNTNNGEVALNTKPWIFFIIIIIVSAIMTIAINYSVVNKYSETLNESVVSKYLVNQTISDIEYTLTNDEFDDEEKLQLISSMVSDFRDEIGDKAETDE